jgi:hypothetical protein
LQLALLRAGRRRRGAALAQAGVEIALPFRVARRRIDLGDEALIGALLSVRFTSR